MCDFKLPSYHDLDLLEKIKIIDLTISVIITGYSDVRVAVEAVRQGTFGWVTKPLHTEEILATIHSAFGSDEPVEASVSKTKKNKKTRNDVISLLVLLHSPLQFKRRLILWRQLIYR